jgi:hypothetical protein
MINLGKNNIKNLIIELLSEGSKKSIDIIEEIKSLKPGTTKQAVYLALRKLIKEEIVVKYRKKLMLNQVWVDQLNEFVNLIDKNYIENYKQTKSKNEYNELKEGDKIIYLFKNLDSFDAFWNHIFSMIVKKTNILSPLYLYNPHEWFLFAREKSEKYMYGWIERKKPKTFFAIGGDTFLDKIVAKKYSSDLMEISIGKKLGFENNYCLAILEDYLIETYLDKKLTDKIDAIYCKSDNEEKAAEKIKEIVSAKSKFKIVVSINPEKSSRIKKKFEKVFFIPQNVKNL